ncbi:MAG: preprotein translocase subunit SecG [Phycisphaerales bacterium]|nr:MAG: preprotein translocase subunit SecG [Phycisphaerales bacterium]
MLAQMSWGQWFGAMLLIVVCCFLMLVILLQRGRGGGLAGAFGGAGGSTAFGAKTGDVFTWITVVVAAIFVILSVLSNFWFDESAPRRTTRSAPAPTEMPATAPSGEPVPLTPPPTTETIPAVPVEVGTGESDEFNLPAAPGTDDGVAGTEGDQAEGAQQPDTDAGGLPADANTTDDAAEGVEENSSP